MKNVLKTLSWSPLTIILLLVASGMFIFGLYLASPFYLVGNSPVVGQVFDLRPVQYVLSVFYVTPFVMLVTGLFNSWRKLMRWSAFGTFIIYTFAGVLRLATIGLTPMFWLFLLILGLIAGVIWLFWEYDNGGK